LQLDNEAIVLDSNNPMLYAKRSLTNLRLNQIENSIEDLNTARTFGPDTWAVPDAMLMNITVYSEFDLAVGLEYASRVAELAPQDWFSNGMVATLSYLNQDFEKAQRYVDITLPLNPRSNFLYSVAISLALREGDFLRAQSLLLEVLEKFPDPRFTERVIRVAFSPDATQSVLIPYASAFGNFTLRRWQEVIRDTEEVLASGFLNSDLYFLQGFSYCNLDLLAEAEAAYTQGIESDSQAYLLYFMRAEVRRAQGNLLGALSDIASVNNSPLGAQLAPLILASTNPETDVSCKTFIDLDLQALGFTAEVTDTDTD
jgi:tetratricopeptide (TPR) repeat protein